MLFNRIINDIVDWVRRLLYWQKNEIKHKPYKVIEAHQGIHGLLRLVERDTPRAVMTYIFTPKPTSGTNVVNNLFDYHICLDHLWAVDTAGLHVKSFALNNNIPSFKPLVKKPSRPLSALGEPSHTVTILKASRWLDNNGDYQTEVVYYKQFDFIGTDATPYRDKYAVPAFKDVINQLKYKRFTDLDWDWEITFSQRRFMGSRYIKPTETDKHPPIMPLT